MVALQNVNDTYYNASTHKRLTEVLEEARLLAKKYNRDKDIFGCRLHLIYGDKDTGEVWQDCTPSRGYVGRSTGMNAIPLLIRKRTSMGGEAIMDNNILQVRCKRMGAETILWDYRFPDLHWNALMWKVKPLLIQVK